jgi:ATP-binding cassette subfamily B protein
LQRLPFPYHAQAETGDLIQAMHLGRGHDPAVYRFPSARNRAQLSLVVTSLVVLFVLDPMMALVSMAVTPLIFATSLVYFRKERAAFKKWDEAEGALSTMLQESLTGVRVVKAFARQAFERQKFDEKNRDLRDFGWKTFQNHRQLLDVFRFHLPFADHGPSPSSARSSLINGRLSLVSWWSSSPTRRCCSPASQPGPHAGRPGKMHVSFGRLKEILDKNRSRTTAIRRRRRFRVGSKFRHVGFSI